MTDILIFESDLDFARAIEGELLRRGCNVSTVSDATEGLQQAASKPPDLILLCAELPRMNGFSVCNRLKRDPDLQKVPVIIMSANSSEETFQAHRNLTKKRAQDYVHKPVPVTELIDRAEQLINLGTAQPVASETSLEELDLDDMEEIDGDGLDDLSPDEFSPPASGRGQSSRPPASTRPPPGAASSLSSEVDVSIDALVDPLGKGHAAPASNKRSSSPAPSKPESLSPLSPRRASAAPGPDSERPSKRVPTLAEPNLEGEVSAERVADLEQTLAATRSKLEAMYRQLDDLKARETSGSAKAHEILELREQIHRRDKELIDLRDQLTRRDKELLGANDRALELDRKSHEAYEALSEVQKQLHAAERAQEAALEDREQANRRADSHKRKHEKAMEDLADAEQRAGDAQGRARELQQRVDDLEQLNRELSGQGEQLRTQLEAARAEAAGAQEQLAATQRHKEQAEQQLRATEVQLEESQSEATRAQDRLEEHEATHASVIDALTSSLERLKKLRPN